MPQEERRESLDDQDTFGGGCIEHIVTQVGFIRKELSGLDKRKSFLVRCKFLRDHLVRHQVAIDAELKDFGY